MEYQLNQGFSGRPSRSPALSTLSAQEMDHVRTPIVVPSKNGFLSPGLNTQHQSLAQIDSAPVMLNSYMASGRTGPWSHFAAFPENGNRGSSAQAVGPFYDYRNAASVSVASDSGYASLSKRVIDEISTMGDSSFNPDIQTISAEIGTFSFNATNASEEEMSVSQSSKTVTAVTNTRSELRCPECNRSMKTKSMLKKHQNQHRKPYICNEPNCNRDGGFGTQNDLDRHKRTVHNILSGKSPKLYQCTIYRCKDKGKIWPRADNFRVHLRQVHHISVELTNRHDYLDRFLASTAISAKPPCENGSDLLQGVGAGSVGSDIGPGGFPTSMVNWPTEGFSVLRSDQSVVPGGNQIMSDQDDLRLEPMEGVMRSPISQQSWGHLDIPPQVQETLSHLPRSLPVSAFGRPDSGEGKPLFPVPPQRRTLTSVSTGTTSAMEPRLTYQRPTQKETKGSDITAPRPEDTNAESADNEASSSALTLRRQPDESMGAKTESSYETDLDTNPRSRTSASREDKAQEEDEMKKILDRIPTDVLSRYLKQQGISPTSDGARDNSDSGTKQKHQCTRCERGFPRRSELNKHMRRHDKPYGCTFPKCNSDFGSKSDWRRHENSQHFQLAVWKCDEPIGEGFCPKTCYGRNVFEAHLRKDHGVTAEDAVERQEGCRVDRSTNDRFWCGFCNTVIFVDPLINNGAWGERYDHIGNHFTGCNGFPKVDKRAWNCGDTESTHDETDEAEEMDTDVGPAKRKRQDSQDDSPSVKKQRARRA